MSNDLILTKRSLFLPAALCCRMARFLSASFSPGNQKPYIERIKLNENAATLNKCFKALVLTQGGPTDIAYNNCKETRGYLDAAGIKYEYMENAQAGHSWTTWRADLATLAPALFR